MKLEYIDQDFQTDAVDAVADLFIGQQISHGSFTIQSFDGQQTLETEYGVGNKMLIDNDKLLYNMHQVQKRNNLPLTELNSGKGEFSADFSFDFSKPEPPQFSVEMETGTGKTFVYTKTIFELHKQYRFTKFIIVVPSVAIREGVYKSLEVTTDYFRRHYENVPFRYFIYNSSRLPDVRQFATSADIEIMIINIDAFKKAENVINQQHDTLSGGRAIKYINDTNPVVIIDEPQSVDNTPKAKEAIASLNPLCVLRYSATHREKINLLYRLTPVDAYQRGLVKQICVSSSQTVNNFNKPYVRLVSVTNENNIFSAKVEIDVQNKAGKVSRKVITVNPDADLYKKSGGRSIYEGYKVSGIVCTHGMEGIEFINTEYVRLGEAIGNLDEDILKRDQISRTIEAHFTKEMMFHEKGIKVLSLFFIDEVKKYRTDDGGKGIYARMFEECYQELLNRPKFAPLKEKFDTEVSKAHDGYFSQDKKGNYKNTRGDTAADDDTYNTIMRDKEWLLSFDCPLRFIFSHSALKEGWDNPNVFQVCTLIEQKSTFTARQKVGRGLRLCVNQDGVRVVDKQVNILHVMANESFAEFAQTLQREIEQDTGVKFGYVEASLFSGLAYSLTNYVEKAVTEEDAAQLYEVLKQNGIVSEDGELLDLSKIDSLALPVDLEGVKSELIKILLNVSQVDVTTLSGLGYIQSVTEEKTISYEEAQELVRYFEGKGYVNSDGKIKDTLKQALLSGKLNLPQKFEGARQVLIAVLSEADKKPPLLDASRDVVVSLNEKLMDSREFKELWKRMKQKTYYRVNVDTEQLIRDCVNDISMMDPIPKARIISETANIHIKQSGVSHTVGPEYNLTELERTYDSLPNIIGILSEQCLITRQSVSRILKDSGRLEDFINNPQLFIEVVTQIINNHRHHLAIEKIEYILLPGDEYSLDSIFDNNQRIANLDVNAVKVVKVEKSLYDYVVYDSETIEKPFALALDKDPDVKLFFKIPSKFKIETPIGNYNPDWAVVLEDLNGQLRYLVIETKGTDDPAGRRDYENLKIYCGKRHFPALKNGLTFHTTTSWSDLRRKLL